MGHVSVMILGCEWQKSAQTGFCKESARCTCFQNGSSVSSIFRNPFILGLLVPWDDKVATVGKLSFPTAPNSGQSLMSHLVTCPCKPVPLKSLTKRPQEQVGGLQRVGWVLAGRSHRHQKWVIGELGGQWEESGCQSTSLGLLLPQTGTVGVTPGVAHLCLMFHGEARVTEVLVCPWQS